MQTKLLWWSDWYWNMIPVIQILNCPWGSEQPSACNIMKSILLNYKIYILFRILLKGPIDNKTALPLVWVMAGLWTWYKPLPESMITEFTGAFGSPGRMAWCCFPGRPWGYKRYKMLSEAYTLHWRHNERDGVSNHRYLDCLLNHLFSRSKKT